MTAIAPVSAAGAASRAPGGQSVTIERGDSLSAIASRHGVSLKSLIAANPQIANPQRIYPGDTITVPGGMGGAAPAAARRRRRVARSRRPACA